MPTMLDDRKRMVNQVRLRALHAREDGSAAEALASVRKRLRGIVRSENNKLTPIGCIVIPIAVVLWFFVFGGLLSALETIRMPPGMMAVLPIVFLAGLIGALYVGRWVVRKDQGFNLSCTVVGAGFCGSCGYSLESLAVEEDGCHLCPECGAAWNADRVSRPHWRPRPYEPERHVPALHAVLIGLQSKSALIAPDDRGAFVRVVDNRLRLLPSEHRSQIAPDLLKRLRFRARLPGLWFRIVLMVAIGAFGVVLLWMFMQTMDGARARWIAGICVVVIFGGAMFGVALGSTHIPRHHAAKLLTHQGLCGCCAARLLEVEPMEDQYTTCPNCGAGWYIPNPYRPMPSSRADARPLAPPTAPTIRRDIES